MSLIPDCRQKYLRNAFPSGTYTRSHGDIGEKELSPYYEGNLKEDDATFIDGYDYALENPCDSFFQNLDIYADKLKAMKFLEKAFGKDWLDTIDMDALSSEELPKGTTMTPATRFFRALRLMLFDFCEMDRNELITSMIDGYDVPHKEGDAP